MKSTRKDIFISFTDQAFLSFANFMIGIFLIKSASKEEYGVYVIAYAVILFIGSVQNALITNQMTVMAPRKRNEEQDHFCSALVIGQYLLAIPLGALSILLIFLFINSGFIAGANSNMFLAVVIATQGILLREFFRVFFFLKMKPKIVLLIDMVHVAVMFSGLFVARSLCPEHLNVAAILVFGLSSLISGVLASYWSGIPLKTRLVETVMTLREAWLNGRWALGGVVVTWLESQSYIYLLSFLSGPASVAEVSAARLFLMPVALLNISVFRVLMPKWAYYRSGNQVNHISTSAKKALIFIATAICVYLIALLSFKDAAIRLFLTKEYAKIDTLIILWGCLFLAQAFRSNFSALLQVFEKFRAITLLNMLSATVVILSSVYLVRKFGADGSIVGMIAGEIILSTLLFVRLRKTIST